MRLRLKAFAYVTQGERLLVFKHPFALEAGIQVPAGTVEPGEMPRAAVLREAHEETRLHQFQVVRFLGVQTQNMRAWGKSEFHQRYFYHLRCAAQTPNRWQHSERFPDGETGQGVIHIFEFYWVQLSHVPPLAANHDWFLDQLRADLHISH